MFEIQSTIYSVLSVLKKVVVSDYSVDDSFVRQPETIIADPLHSIIDLTKRNNFLKHLNRAPIVGIVSRQTYTEKPLICKNSCIDCKAKVTYSIAELEEPTTKILQTKIRNELFAHGHAKTRKGRDKKQVGTDEQRSELISHLKFKHKEAFN